LRRSDPGRQRVLLVGGGAREHAIGEALCRGGDVELLTVAQNRNPGLAELSELFASHSETDVAWITSWAQEQGADFAVIGLEDPLEAGLSDALNEAGVPTVGPSRRASRIETSKLFTRELMQRHEIPGRVLFKYFFDPDELGEFLSASDKQFALKPIGLTAGKGVKVMGVQLGSTVEAVDYGRAVIERRIGGQAAVLVEERLIGEEFTLQVFVDGITVLPMPLVKDYKCLYEQDRGPNTGSMGSYSQPDGLLPFLTSSDRDAAMEILRQVVSALDAEASPYRGIMYGQFMLTTDGVKLVEINARFGDPEAVNVLSLLETDFVAICRAITDQTLGDVALRFAPLATVCKYITPPGYGVEPRVGVPLRLDRREIEKLGVKIFFARVDQGNDAFLTTTSRSLALVGIADSVQEAEARVESALAYVEGEYHLRHDIGKLVAQASSEKMEGALPNL
jgi:phosphoribosylamine--glycine ligase